MPFAVAGRWRAITIPATSTRLSLGSCQSDLLSAGSPASCGRMRLIGWAPRVIPVDS